MLAQRLELLEEVGRLQASLGVQGDVSYTCETAAHFFLYQVSYRIAGGQDSAAMALALGTNLTFHTKICHHSRHRHNVCR